MKRLGFLPIWPRSLLKSVFLGLPLFLGSLLLVDCGVVAQVKQKTGGSPLDTLMNTRLWADVPEAKDFVRESRPPSESLDYLPTTPPQEIPRPKLKSKDELQALQAELERAGKRNQAQVGRRSAAKISRSSGKAKSD